MLRVSQVNQSIDEPMERLHQRICKKLRIRERDLIRFPSIGKVWMPAVDRSAFHTW